MPQQQPLERTSTRMRAGELDELALDAFPDRQRIQQQATVLINGNNNLPGGGILQRLTVSGRY